MPSPGAGDVRCLACDAPFHVITFPALWAPRENLDSAELIAGETEAACFEHASKRAVASCNQCGRFVCALCRMEAGETVLCPTCFVSGVSRSKLNAVEKQRVLYDSIALGAAGLPMLLGYLALLTAPVAIFVTLRFWKRPSSLVPRSKWRLIVALVLSILEIVALIFLISIVIWAVRQRATQ